MGHLGERDMKSRGGIKVGDGKKMIQWTPRKVRAVVIQVHNGAYRRKTWERDTDSRGGIEVGDNKNNSADTKQG